MSACSLLDRLKTNLRKQDLTNSNLEAPLSKEGQLTKYVSDITKLAKKKYKIDMGNIFSIKRTTNIKLVPNVAAIEAIERTPEYELEQINADKRKNLTALDKNKLGEDLSGVQSEVASNQSSTINVKDLPELEITC